MTDVIELAAGLPAALSTPADLMRLAVQSGATIDQLERLMLIQERWEANEARKAYTRAMTLFKATPPVINKTKTVEFSGTSYKHATIGDVTTAVIAGLSRQGLSHRWGVEQPGDGRIVVLCVLTHELGHSESTRLEATADISGKKNPIQSVASAVSYLQRYTLLLATGLATHDQVDDDGRGAGANAPAIREQLDLLLAELRAITTDEAALEFWKAQRDSLRADRAAYEVFTRQVTSLRNKLREAATTTIATTTITTTT